MPQAQAKAADAAKAAAKLKHQEQDKARREEAAAIKKLNKERGSNKGKKKTKVDQQPAATNKKKKVTSHPRYNRRIGGHSGNILSMSISPNGEWIATSGVDGQLRVTKVNGEGSNAGEALSLSCVVQSDKDLGNFKDQLTNLVWSSEDDRTIIGIMKTARLTAFYRMRKKKSADTTTSKNPYELIELVKRRISLDSKIGNDVITSCLVDHTNTKFCLLVMGTDATHNNVTTWNVDADGGKTVGPTTTISDGNDNKVRISPDGKFICSRIESKASQVRIFEMHKSKVKGEVEPVFDKISTKSVMTISPPKGSGKIIDVDFLSGGIAVIVCSTSTGPCIQLWDLNVEYQNKQDPIMLCTCTPSELSDKDISMIETSNNNNRISITTTNGSLFMFRYDTSKKEVTYDFTIDEPHTDDVIGDMQFCSTAAGGDTSTTIYTRGQRSKDVYCWNTN